MEPAAQVQTEMEQLLGHPIASPRVLRLSPRFHQEFRLISEVVQRDGRLRGREFYVLLVAERTALDRVTRLELPEQQAGHGCVTADSESVAQIAARLQAADNGEVLIGSAHWHPGGLGETGFLSPQDLELLGVMAEEMSPQLLEFQPAAERTVQECRLRLTPRSTLRLNGAEVDPSLLGANGEEGLVLSVGDVQLQEPQAQSAVYALVNAGEGYYGRCLVTRYCPAITCRAPHRTVEALAVEVEAAPEGAEPEFEAEILEELVQERIEPTRFWLWRNKRQNTSPSGTSYRLLTNEPVAAVQEGTTRALPASTASEPEAATEAPAETESPAPEKPEPLAVAIAAASQLVDALQQMMFERAGPEGAAEATPETEPSEDESDASPPPSGCPADGD